ncbi:c-type cytochrome [Bacillus sp. 1P06AnD]|uniref:c-type cytochrome n=1 Tax=Bacillus sp. 1P06AnD TaxID=3132208 RepID=UPI0039A1FDA7
MNRQLWYGFFAFIGVVIIGFFVLLMVIISPEKSKDSQMAAAHPVVQPKAEAPPRSTADVVDKKYKKYMPPSIHDVPGGPEGEKIKQGYKYMTETASTLDGYVGNKLSCVNCHANGGTGPALDLIGITKVYPKYNSRADKIITIEDRVNGCFRRSMNGKPLEKDSPVMDAMVAYLDYISSNVPEETKERPWGELQKVKGDITKVNVDNGREIFQKACISCHGENGDGNRYGLAVFGENSYNIGAGMARLRTAAAFIQNYMPLVANGGYEPGSLTEQEAIDVAAYINGQPRPDFADKIYDWPKGDAPDDAAYETLAQKKKKE